MSDHSERRAYERIPLLAYARDKSCRLASGQDSFQASLVDISNGGARIRLGNGSVLARGQALRFSLECGRSKGLLQEIESSVRWMAGLDLGIRFDTPLGLPLITLQDMVS